MAEITTTQSFADGDTVTAAKLNNILGNSSISSEIITNRAELAVVDGANDFVLGYDTSASSLRKIKANNLVADASISANKIENLAVTTGKINDLAVTTGKINDLAVTTGKIANEAITSSKIGTLSPSPEGTYGGSSSVPVIVVNSKGQVTSATTSAIPTVDAFAVGMVMPYAGSTAPSKWSICNGSAISRSTYASLFSALGTIYGSGDGSTTFNIPDLRGRSPIGAGTGAGLTARTLAGTGGSETVTLTDQIGTFGSHTHSIGLSGTLGAARGVQPNGGNSTSTGASTVSGSGASHANMQPFLVLNYIIYHGV